MSHAEYFFYAEAEDKEREREREKACVCECDEEEEKKGQEGQAKEEAESCQGVERVEGGLTHLFLLDEEGLRRYRVGACGHMSQPRGSRVVLLHASWRVVGVESQRRERTQLYTAEDTLTVFFA